MLAILYDPAAPCGLRLGDAPEPKPDKRQALVEVHAAAINFADVAFLAKRFKPGDIVGFEAAGTVIEPAADGSGPQRGARVTGFGSAGGWAERRVVDVDQLTEIPNAVDLAVASAIPVAGVTALRAVRALGSVVGRRILVTGASGGVGQMAVQLAARAGAYVIACVGKPERGIGLVELGAREVVVDLTDIAPVYGVLENVGGELLAQAYTLVEPSGWLLSIGMASLAPTLLDFELARLRGGGRIEAFNVFTHGGAFRKDLAALLDWIAAGHLKVEVGWRGDWTQIVEAVEAFRGRRVRGKAVLDVRGTRTREMREHVRSDR
jgi:NADPH:quinone reductase